MGWYVFPIMSATLEHVGETLIVTPSGRLDTVAAPALDAQLAPVLATAHPRIVVDLSSVSYISSAGLRSILQLVKHTAAHGGRLGLFAASSQIMEIVEISGFSSLLDVYPDRASALNG